jgi:hypothetical protein
MIISNKCIVLLSILFIKSFANTESSKCLILLNNNIQESNKPLIISNDQSYHLAFGSKVDELKNVVVGYSIDVKCNLNSTSRSFYNYDIKYLPIEINLMNCSKDLSFRNIALFNNGSIDFFMFETMLFKSNITDLFVSITMNRRFGNGCTGSLFFTKNTSFSIRFVNNLNDLWHLIKNNFFCFFLLILLIITLTLLTIMTVSHLREVLIFEKKQIQINVPSIKFTKTSKNIRFDSLSHLTENNNPSIVENLDSTMPSNEQVLNEQITNEQPNTTTTTTTVTKLDESVQADYFNQFQVLREQFNSKTDSNRDSARNLGSRKNQAFQQ